MPCGLHFVGLVIAMIIHFTISSVIPIFNKEFFLKCPYPLFDTFVQMLIALPILIPVAWAVEKFPCSLKFLVPKIQTLPMVIISSVLFGAMMFTGNLGFHVSDVDFAVLFRITTIATSSLCGFVFLHERVNLLGGFAIVLVIIGVFILASKFQWSTAKLPSMEQLLIQISAVLTSSLSSLTLKISIRQLEDIQDYRPFTYLVWRFFFALFPILAVALIVEAPVLANLDIVLNKDFVNYSIVGLMLTIFFQLLNVILHKNANMITLSVISQMKFIPTLIISSLRYNATQWTQRQIIGAILLLIGAFLYSISRIDCKKKENQGELENLISGNGDSMQEMQMSELPSQENFSVCNK